MHTIDPSNENVLQEYPQLDNQAVDDAVHRAYEAQRQWAVLPFSERALRLRRCAELLIERHENYAHTMTQEMGKPIREARAEIKKCALVCEHYAEHAESYLAEQTSADSTICYQPIGCVFAIMPWNFPFWQVFRMAAPTLMAGNALLFKHAPNVLGSGMHVQSIFHDAGVPSAIVQHLVIDHAQASDLISDPRIAAVTLTGSTRAGRAVAAQAGAALKRSVMELGGSDPFIVLDDANLDTAVTGALQGRLMNAGQSCIASKRFLVHEALHDRFVARLGEAIQQLTVGDPLEEETDLGPLARVDLRDTLHQQVLDTVTAGAQLRLGGTLPEGPGAFYPPTLITEVRPGMVAAEEELFGPVFAILRVTSEQEALQIANASVYGLGASVWTEDSARAQRVARALDCGCVSINETLHSHPARPFGGVKQSGYGRELGREGILEFVNVKCISGEFSP